MKNSSPNLPPSTEHLLNEVPLNPAPIPQTFDLNSLPKGWDRQCLENVEPLPDLPGVAMQVAMLTSWVRRLLDQLEAMQTND